MKHKVYVYGTLRPGGASIHLVPGFLHDLGYYPGIRLQSPTSDSFVACELIEVTDEELERLDYYEGYCESDLRGSLYLRTPYLGGWIYTYNHDLSKYPVVECGDWLQYKNQEEGTASRRYIPKEESVEASRNAVEGLSDAVGASPDYEDEGVGV